GRPPGDGSHPPPVHRGGVAERLRPGHGAVAAADPAGARLPHRGHFRDPAGRLLTPAENLSHPSRTLAAWTHTSSMAAEHRRTCAATRFATTDATQASPAQPAAAWKSTEPGGRSTHRRGWPPCA